MNAGRRLWLASLAVAAAMSLAPAAQAAYPDKPVRIVVPFAAGGATDIWARAFARRLSLKLGQPVIVENRAGANTTIGAASVARSPNDGYTLLFTSGTHIQVPVMYPNTPYDVIKDFSPVARLGTVGLMFVVNPSVTAKNMREFIDQARQRKDWTLGTYAAGSTGAVFSQHLAATEKLALPVANYKGEAPAIADAVAGQIQGGLFSGQGVKAFVRAGRLKALGALGNERHPSFPDVPTLVEQNLPAMTHPGIWVAMFAPAKTPDAVVDALAQASQAVVNDPEFRKEWADLDIGVSYRGPKDFGQDIVGELASWRDLVTKLGIKAE